MIHDLLAMHSAVVWEIFQLFVNACIEAQCVENVMQRKFFGKNNIEMALLDDFTTSLLIWIRALPPKTSKLSLKQVFNKINASDFTIPNLQQDELLSLLNLLPSESSSSEFLLLQLLNDSDPTTLRQEMDKEPLPNLTSLVYEQQITFRDNQKISIFEFLIMNQKPEIYMKLQNKIPVPLNKVNDLLCLSIKHKQFELAKIMIDLKTTDLGDWTPQNPLAMYIESLVSATDLFVVDEDLLLKLAKYSEKHLQQTIEDIIKKHASDTRIIDFVSKHRNILYPQKTNLEELSKTKSSDNRPILILCHNEPGTSGDIGFVHKLIEAYRRTEQKFIVWVDNMSVVLPERVLQFPCDQVDEVMQLQCSQYLQSDGKEWPLHLLSQTPLKAILYAPLFPFKTVIQSTNEYAKLRDVPCVLISEYGAGHKYPNQNAINTGAALNECGLFLPDYQPHTSSDQDNAKWGGQPITDVAKDAQIYFSYLNNREIGDPNPAKFKQELLGYLCFATSAAVLSNKEMPTRIFSRITDDIFKSYLEALKARAATLFPGVQFSICYQDARYMVPDPPLDDSKKIRTMEVNLYNPFPLQHDTMIAMMQTCKEQGNPVYITGDQSLSEAISIGGPFLYQCMSWKENSLNGLRRRAEVTGCDGLVTMLDQKNFDGDWPKAHQLAQNYSTNRQLWCDQFEHFKENVPNLDDTLPMALQCIIEPGYQAVDQYLRLQNESLSTTPPLTTQQEDISFIFKDFKAKMTATTTPVAPGPASISAKSASC